MITALILLIPLLGTISSMDGTGRLVVLLCWALLFLALVSHKARSRNRNAIAYEPLSAMAAARQHVLAWGISSKCTKRHPCHRMYSGTRCGALGAAVGSLRPNGMASALLAAALAERAGPGGRTDSTSDA